MRRAQQAGIRIGMYPISQLTKLGSVAATSLTGHDPSEKTPQNEYANNPATLAAVEDRRWRALESAGERLFREMNANSSQPYAAAALGGRTGHRGNDATSQRVIDLVSQQMRIPKENVTLASRFRDDLGADELDSVELAMELEDALGVAINDKQWGKLNTVDDAVRYIQKAQSRQPGRPAGSMALGIS